MLFGGMTLAVVLWSLAAPPGAGMQIQQVDERAWEKDTRDKLAAAFKVAPADLQFSPGKRRVAWVVVPPPAPAPRRSRRPPPPPKFHVFVADVTGKLQRGFRPVNVKDGVAGPKDLRFVDDDRLVYEVVLPPPEAPRAIKGKRPRARAPEVVAPLRPPPERRLLVIQPVARRARPIRCEGFGFTWSPRKDRLAFVSGTVEAGVMVVDGKRVYPRRGRTSVVADPAWSPDGASLALVEAQAAAAARLVMVPNFEDATSDTRWDLPPTVSLADLHVFWAGNRRLVAGKTVTSPAFATSFELEGND